MPAEAETKPLDQKQEKQVANWEETLDKLKKPLEGVTTEIVEDTDKKWSQFLPGYTATSATVMVAKIDAFAASLALIMESKQASSFANVAKEYKALVEHAKETTRGAKLQLTEAKKHATARA